MKKLIHTNVFLVCIILLLCLPVFVPFLKPGYFPTHDGEWAVVRLTDMFRSLKDFQFPVRYSGNLNFGYGYPLFNFVYPLPYYLGVVIHLFGIGFVNVIKLLFVASIFVSAVGMYYLSKEFWNSKFAGFLSALLYIYFPYRFVDLYVRGSLGESLSFALFPLLLLIILHLSKAKKKLPLIFIGGLVYASLIMTHNIMALLFTPLVILFSLFIWNENGRKDLRKYFLIPISGLLLSAFFWVPALIEKKHILLSVIPIAERKLYFVTLQQLLIPSWGYDNPTEKTGFSYQLGLAQILVLITSLVVFVLLVKKKKLLKGGRKIFFLFVLFFATTLMLFQFTALLWENLPLLSEINYPWTLLAIIGVISSLLAGFLVYNKKTLIFGFGIVVIAIITTLPYAKPREYVDRGDNFYLTNDATTTSSSELMPLWVKSFPFERAVKKVEVLEGRGTVEAHLANSKNVTITANMHTDGKVRINTIYYPGWEIVNNGRAQKFSYKNDKGVMDISLEKGTHSLKALFKETPLRVGANLISIMTFMGFILVYIVSFREKIFRKKP